MEELEIKHVARLVTQVGEHGFFFGAVMNGQGVLKPGYVYDIRQIGNDILVLEVGPSHMTESPETSKVPELHFDPLPPEKMLDQRFYMTGDEVDRVMRPQIKPFDHPDPNKVD